MAIFDSTIFRKMKNSVGNVTTYMSGSQNIVRAKVKPRDRKTLKQLKQRARMKIAWEMWYHFVEILPVGFCSSSFKVFSNRFIQANIGKVYVDDELNMKFNLTEVVLSVGPLVKPLLDAKIDVENRRVVFRWKRQPLKPLMLDDDGLYGVVHEFDEEETKYELLGVRGEGGELEWPIPEGWNARRLVVYGFALTASSHRASESMYLAMGPDMEAEVDVKDR